MTTPVTVTEKRDAIEKALVKRADAFTKVLPPALPFDRFQMIVMGEIARTPTLVNAYPPSIIIAAMQAATLGLEINSALGEAYLVPFRNNKKGGRQEAQLIVGYRGYVTLAMQSPRVVNVRGVAVRTGESFDVEEGTKPHIFHKPDVTRPFDTKGDDIVAAYAVADLVAPGSPLTSVFRVMTRGELDEVRRTSKGADRSESPWNRHTPEMFIKCPIRKVAKILPLSDGLRQALTLDHDGERLGAEDKARAREVRERIAKAADIPIEDAEIVEEADEVPT